MGNFGWEIRKISPHSKTKMSIPPDVIRKAEMQMKRKAPDDLNGEQHKTRSKKANAAASSSTSSLQFDYALEKQFRENSVAGFALTCVMHRERSAMKEALELLRECLDDDFTKISPMKMPCKAFAFLSVAEEKLQLELVEVVTRVVRIVLNRQNEVRFLERMIPIQTTCEYTDDAIERAVERLGITNQSNEFKTFAVCHRDCFSKALVAKEDTKDEMEKWKSMAVTNAVAKAVSKRIDKVSLKDPDVVIFVVVLAVNDNGIKNTDNIPTRRLGLSYATRESKVFTVKSKGIVATNLKP
jgi:tRNA(Ser,Leu) C12 N-acetylase TAN1|tara:strand:+ start:942 stop:1835 length:894 start_codon:yes stop_codon:yes gene_type:complete